MSNCGNYNASLIGAIIAMIIGLILLIVGICAQTGAFKNTEENPIDKKSWLWWFFDALGFVLIVISIVIFATMNKSKLHAPRVSLTKIM